MKYITLPSGKKLSKIGLGVSRFGTRTPDWLADEMLGRFLAAGGTLIDTARNYYEWVENGRGKSEEFMGRWMESHGCRDQIVLSTKGGVSNEGKKFLVDLSREGLLAELRQSLEALRTDYVDIYLLHRDEPDRPVEEIVDSLQALSDVGRCENIGVCNWRCERIQTANQYAQRHGLRPIRFVQTWWSIASYVSYFCSVYNQTGRCICSWHRIYEQTLAKIVLAEIKAHAQAVTLDESAVIGQLKSKVAGFNEQRLSSTRQEISRLRRRVHELESLTAKLYEDKYSGAISENTFVMLMQKNEQERLIKAERLETLLSELDQAEKKIAAIQSWAAIIRKYLNLQELDRTVVEELIDHIEIGERTVVDGQRHQDIKVFYRFVGLVL